VNALVGGDPKILDHLPFNEIWAVDFEFDSQPGESNYSPRVGWSRAGCLGGG
jgi:hypothetical protein